MSQRAKNRRAPKPRETVAAKPGPTRRRRGRRSQRIALYAFLAFLGSFAALLLLVFVFALRSGPGEGAYFELDIPAGLTSSELAELLVEEGVADSQLLTSLYFGLSPGPEVVTGTHWIAGGKSPIALREALSRGPFRAEARVVIPEGLHRFAVAERLAKAGVCSAASFLRVTSDPMFLQAQGVPGVSGLSPRSAEGFLFPATYPLRENTPAEEVARRMIAESHTRYARLTEGHREALARLERELGWGRGEIVTLASMVEKETGAADERPLIAGVFFNRLLSDSFQPKLLQSDPTSGYGCLALESKPPSCAGYTGKITGAMNRDLGNVYSTYAHPGLPPGPIANPGEAAILAVLEPTKTDAFYFVATGGGRHAFSRTLEEHNKAMKR